MSNNTINKEEVEKFSKIAEEWWNPNGKFKPFAARSPANNEHEICSPAETRASYSLSGNFSLIFFDILINLLVVPLIADDKTITLYFFE